MLHHLVACLCTRDATWRSSLQSVLANRPWSLRRCSDCQQDEQFYVICHSLTQPVSQSHLTALVGLKPLQWIVGGRGNNNRICHFAAMLYGRRTQRRGCAIWRQNTTSRLCYMGAEHNVAAVLYGGITQRRGCAIWTRNTSNHSHIFIANLRRNK